MNDILNKEITRYSKKNGYVATEFEEYKCKCSSGLFTLFSDDEEGCAGLICVKCESDIDINDSMQYSEKYTQNICTCGNTDFEVTKGTAFYDGGMDPRWVYVGCKCPKCNLVGVYVDWQER